MWLLASQGRGTGQLVFGLWRRQTAAAGARPCQDNLKCCFAYWYLDSLTLAAGLLRPWCRQAVGVWPGSKPGQP